MKKFLSIAIMLIVATGITLGFIMEDPFGSKTTTTDTGITGNNPVHVSYGTPVYTDNFDGANDTAALRSRGYKFYNVSTPVGASWWFQGNATVFNAFNGPTTGYVASNFNATTGAGNISVWLVLPKVSGGTLAGDSLYFYQRSPAASTFPDSIRVYYSTSDSTVGGAWTELGRFKTNVTNWEKKGFRAPTASANGRFAIVYSVVSGGPSGANSDFIGIDALTIERSATPPPVPTGTWTEQTSGLATVLYSVSAVNDDVAWTCGAAGKVLRTTNKGVNWTNVSGNLPAAVAMYNIFAWDANTAIVTGSSTSSFIYKTINGGVNWTTVSTIAGGFDDNLWMTDVNNAYCIGDAVGGNWNLLKSTNGGNNWASWFTMPTTNTSGTYNNAACFLGQQVWWSPVGESKMKYSSNMGVSWADQTLPLANITATWFNNSTLGLAGGSSASAGLLKTTNSGTTWTSLTSPYPTSSASGIVGAQNTWWLSQQGTGISKSTNDGTTWTTDYTAPAGSFYHMTLSRSGATIWAIRSNGGISRYGALISGVTPISTETPSDYSVSQNYPNPFNPTTKINFALPKSGLVTLKIYDITGKEVATLVNEVKNVGTYSVDFNGANLSSGMYFYKISVNGFSEVKKMSLIK
jgi:photosystem II stability/assembly factor-like uncharacterized protein